MTPFAKIRRAIVREPHSLFFFKVLSVLTQKQTLIRFNFSFQAQDVVCTEVHGAGCVKVIADAFLDWQDASKHCDDFKLYKRRIAQPTNVESLRAFLNIFYPGKLTFYLETVETVVLEEVNH